MVVLLFGIVSLCFMVVPAIVVLAVDPYQIYKKNTYGFSPNQRYQIAGLINSYEYENLIFGTSMTENLRAHQVEEALGWSKVLRLSISGGMPKAMTTALKYALDRRPVKNVLSDIHWYYAVYDADHEEDQHPFPYYLYKDTLERDINYIFNRGVFELSLGLLGLQHPTEVFSSDLERLNAWMDEKLYAEYSRPSNLEKLAEKVQEVGNKFNFDDMKNKNYEFPSIDKNLLPLVKAHPGTEFHLFFPPYSLWHYATADRQKAEKTIMLRWAVVQKLSAFKNVHIYGYDNVCEITCWVRNYYDYGHYRQEIAEELVKTVKQNRFQLNELNIEDYMTSFILLINEYSVEKVRANKSFDRLKFIESKSSYSGS